MSDLIRIDARGMRCPWPAVRLARALRDGATTVEVIADDPQAPVELAAIAAGAGAELKIVLDQNSPTFRVSCR